MNPKLKAILDCPLPAVRRAELRDEPRKVWAAEVRKLLRDLGLSGISVTTPNYSMASTILVRIPPREVEDEAEHERLHDRIFREGRPSLDCPDCAERWQARQKVRAIILAAFPDLDDRSDPQVDYFDYCVSVE